MKKIVPLCMLFIAFVFPKNGQAQFNKNVVIAHRGAWKESSLPENSIASLKQAIQLGCHGSEFDVHLTKDDSLVVNHDDDFYGTAIASATYKELLVKNLPNGEKIPTVREYLKEGIKQKGTKLIFEIKTSTRKERSLKLTRMSVDLVRELGAQNWVEYICFDYDVGKLVHKLDSKAKVAYLKGDKTPAQVKRDGYTGLDYNYKVYKKHPEWIQEAQDLGLTVNAWTVNDREEMKNLLAQKLDYITTNEPELLLDILNENNYRACH